MVDKARLCCLNIAKQLTQSYHVARVSIVHALIAMNEGCNAMLLLSDPSSCFMGSGRNDSWASVRVVYSL